MEWFRKAADQGYEKAIQSIRLYESADGWYMVATAVFAAYKNGRITDSAEGFELLKRALDAGLPEALNLMGIFCADEAKAAKTYGVTVREDREKAKSLFEAALALKPELAKAENNLKKVTDLIEAEKTGREPNSELKWQIAIKKPGDAR